LARRQRHAEVRAAVQQCVEGQQFEGVGAGGGSVIGRIRVLERSIPSNKTQLVKACIEIHREELMANWNLAINGQEIFKIDPLE